MVNITIIVTADCSTEVDIHPYIATNGGLKVQMKQVNTAMYRKLPVDTKWTLCHEPDAPLVEGACYGFGNKPVSINFKLCMVGNNGRLQLSVDTPVTKASLEACFEKNKLFTAHLSGWNLLVSICGGELRALTDDDIWWEGDFNHMSTFTANARFVLHAVAAEAEANNNRS
jgi:hypothetical protein